MNAARAVTGHSLEDVPSRIWISMLLRAVPALVVALVITFTQERTVPFAFFAFGAFTFVSGLLVALEAIMLPGYLGRLAVFLRGVLSVVAGGLSFALGAIPQSHDVGLLKWIVVGWAIVAGGLWLLAAVQTRGHRVLARESVVAGAMTLLLALVVGITPVDLRDEFGGLEHIEGALTAPVQMIGAVGAYAAVLGVLLAIEALTLRAAIRRAKAGETPDDTPDQTDVSEAK